VIAPKAWKTIAVAALALSASATAGAEPAKPATAARPPTVTKPATGAKPAGGARPAAPTPKRALRAVAASRGWHAAMPGKTAPLDEHGRPLLVLQGLNIPDRVELTARGDHGGFSAEDLDRAAHVMRDHAGNEHPIDPRLLDMVYRLETHFHAHEIRIISGYRTPPRPGATSNHGKGRAMDLVIPGTTDEEVAKFARDEGFCGVGIYPVSGFVHVDVRERSFFWVDSSGPGKRNRTRGVLGDVAARSDAQALARGEHAIGPFRVGTDVDAAIAATAAASHGADDDEDDDGDTSAL
jgi:uncharacterized protein YcbK (DUF882 family)